MKNIFENAVKENSHKNYSQKMIKQSGVRLAARSAFILLTTAVKASAHEKWFHETENYGLRWDLLFRPLPLVFVSAVVIIPKEPRRRRKIIFADALRCKR